MLYVYPIQILFISKELWQIFPKLIVYVMTHFKTLYEIPQYIFPPPKNVLGNQQGCLSEVPVYLRM